MGYSSKISVEELRDLSISMIMLIFAFAVLQDRGLPGLDALVVSAVGAGSGFCLHELAHKFVAQHYGYRAEFMANWSGLVLMIIMSFAGFIFAAPGAVGITGSPGGGLYSGDGSLEGEQALKRVKRSMLWISLAGPMTNLILAGVFFWLWVLSAMPSEMSNYAFFINILLAGFNMLPFGPIDGRKVFEASPAIWALVGVPTIFIALLMFLGIPIF